MKIALAVVIGAGGVVDLLQLELDADRAPHLLQRGRGRGLVGIAGEHDRLDLEAIAEPRLFQQFFGLGDIVGVGGTVPVMERRVPLDM